MFRKSALVFAIGVVVCIIGIDAAAGGGKDKKEKKFEIPKDAIAGTVKSVDTKAPCFTITLKGGKDRTFAVTKETEFWGPKGGDRGTGAKGLADDCMAKGYEIKVAASKDGKSAKDVYLPNRK